ncbi:hypothetical protein PMAYCL1PPCAC_20410, partial [Pristionchus mayeri]
GLNIVPFDAKNSKHWINSAIGSPVEHPYRDLFQKRVDPAAKTTIPPQIHAAPPYYRRKVLEPPLTNNRSDLRFLGVPLAAVPSGTIEGDYFRVHNVDLLSNPSFAVKLSKY